MSIARLLEEIKRWLGDLGYSGYENIPLSLYEEGEVLSKRCRSFGLSILEKQLIESMENIKAYKKGKVHRRKITEKLAVLAFSLESIMSQSGI